MKKFGLFVVMLILLSGCSDKGESLADEAEYYALSLERARLSTHSQAVEDEQFLPQHTLIGLYAADREGGTFNTGDDHRNTSYQVVDENGTISSVHSAILEKNHAYRIYAYAPFRASGLEEEENDVSLSVNHGEDILLAGPAVIDRVSEDNHTATLQFIHRMAQVQFVLEPAPQLGAEYLAGATFKVSGFYESARLSLVNGTLSALTGNGALVTNLPESLKTEAVCVIPDESEQALDVTVTTDKKGAITKSVSFRFEPGKSYQFIIKYTIGLTLEITSAVVLWNDFDGGDINIVG